MNYSPLVPKDTTPRLLEACAGSSRVHKIHVGRRDIWAVQLGNHRTLALPQGGLLRAVTLVIDAPPSPSRAVEPIRHHPAPGLVYLAQHRHGPKYALHDAFRRRRALHPGLGHAVLQRIHDAKFNFSRISWPSG